MTKKQAFQEFCDQIESHMENGDFSTTQHFIFADELKDGSTLHVHVFAEPNGELETTMVVSSPVTNHL